MHVHCFFELQSMSHFADRLAPIGCCLKWSANIFSSVQCRVHGSTVDEAESGSLKHGFGMNYSPSCLLLQSPWS